MEISQILEISTDYLLFGVEAIGDKFWENMLRGKSEGELSFMRIMVKAMADNMEMIRKRKK